MSYKIILVTLVTVVSYTVLTSISFAQEFDVPEPKIITGEALNITYSKLTFLDEVGRKDSLYLSDNTRIYKLIPSNSEEIKLNLYISVFGEGDEKYLNSERILINKDVTQEMIENIKYQMGDNELEKIVGGKFGRVKSIEPIIIESIDLKEYAVKVSPMTEIYDIFSGEISDVKKGDKVNIRILDFSGMGSGDFVMITVYKKK